MDAGSARLGMMVADTFRRKMKITNTTSTIVTSSVSLTSCTDSRIGTDRSVRTSSDSAAGSCWRNAGSNSLTASQTATTLVPGCFWMAR